MKNGYIVEDKRTGELSFVDSVDTYYDYKVSNKISLSYAKKRYPEAFRSNFFEDIFGIF